MPLIIAMISTHITLLISILTAWFQIIGQLLPSQDIMLTSPPYEINDVIAADIILRPKWFTALHVQGDFISNGPRYREILVLMVREQGRQSCGD
jgi:hypothetical protein